MNSSTGNNEKVEIAGTVADAEAGGDVKDAKKAKKGWKTVKIVLLVIACVILIAAAAVAILAGKNTAQMNACVDETIATLSRNHALTEIDTGDYGEMRAYGVLKFHVKQYEIKDLGNLSVMTVNAGVMQMATVIFSPFDKDLPLMSCDYMYMLSTRKAYVEFYDLVAEKDETYMEWMDKYEELRGKYSDLTETSASSGWYDDLITVAIYKNAGMKQDDRIRALLGDAVELYVAQADEYALISGDERTDKIDRIKDYSDRLIDEGGVSTSFFKSALGEDVTRDFFDKVLFGTALYR